jgi:hypothetical protein
MSGAKGVSNLGLVFVTGAGQSVSPTLPWGQSYKSFYGRNLQISSTRVKHSSLGCGVIIGISWAELESWITEK